MKYFFVSITDINMPVISNLPQLLSKSSIDISNSNIVFKQELPKRQTLLYDSQNAYYIANVVNGSAFKVNVEC